MKRSAHAVQERGRGCGDAVATIVRRGYQHAAIAGYERQRDLRTARRLAVTKRNIDRGAQQVAVAVGQVQAQGECWMLALKGVEPGQHDMAAEVGRQGDLQLARKCSAGIASSGASGGHRIERRSNVQSMRSPSGDRRGCACCCHEHRCTPLGLHSLDGGARGGRRPVECAPRP